MVVLVLCAIAILAAAVKGSLFIFGSWRENIILYINPIHSLTATLMGPLLIHLAFRFPLFEMAASHALRFTSSLYCRLPVVAFLRHRQDHDLAADWRVSGGAMAG
ncbi:MAG: hypothetical protein M5U34_00610 [Chloroflexi bacterium]|nr:hypothetical protein [Chloroflexota bacterium]